MRKKWLSGPLSRTIAVAASAAAMTVPLAGAAGHANAAPHTVVIASAGHFWSPPDMDITRARVTYDARTGYLQVAITHRGPRTSPTFSETVALTSTSIYRSGHSEPDGIHIDSSTSYPPTFYVTDDGAQSRRGPVTVVRRGTVTTYTIVSPMTRGRPLRYLSASANNGVVCESMCMPGGSLDERAVRL